MILGARTKNILFIVKVKIFVLAREMVGARELRRLLSLEWLSCFEHIVQFVLTILMKSSPLMHCICYANEERIDLS